jgi:asparagine synthase (glutamine-hydrolysing)
MCGLVGFVGFGRRQPHGLERLLARLAHRGPDDSGLFESDDGRVVLGHARLSIIDLSALGHQPMASEDGRYVIVFNGEIYNHREIRQDLASRGVRFVSDSDTEVLLAAYQAWGQDCLARLNGMYAFVIYDKGSASHPPRLFMARDRAGEKPFYYSHRKDSFAFASELKALDHSAQINPVALNHYLSLGYVPAGLCLFEGVHKLPPAHFGYLNLSTGALEIRPYWSLPPNQARPDAQGADLLPQVAGLIEDSVRLRMVADVPVGVLLSGGLDSSLVAAAAARVSSRPVQTFTISLPGSSLDEAHHAKKVADHLGTEHHVLALGKPSLDLLDGLAPLIDEPIADSSILPAWMVFGLARQKVTVALGGDGGDELFGGYTDYPTSLRDQNNWGWVPPGVFTGLAGLAAQFPAGVKGRNRLASLRGGPLQQMIWGRPYFDTCLRKRLLRPEAWDALRGAQAEPEEFLLSLFQAGTTDMDRMTRTHFGSILPDDFLVKVDRASMAHSLEVRAPMLDHRLIEFCFSQVPDSWKVKDGQSRRLQRLLADNWLPADLDTRRKQGFSIPINEWLRAEGEGRLMERMQSLPDVIDLRQVRGLVRGHLAGRANGGRLFALIMLAMAMRNISP